MPGLDVKQLSLAHLHLTECLVLKGSTVPAYFRNFHGKNAPFLELSPLLLLGLIAQIKSA